MALSFAWLASLGVAAGEAPTRTGDTAAFEPANRLYERGQFAEAVTAYTQLLQAGVVSPALHFNLANAYFKSGQLGRAILHYRQAEHLDPRDPDIQANLRFARNQVRGSKPAAAPWWTRTARRLTLNEWTIGSSVLLWLCLGLAALSQLRPAWSPNLARPIAFLAAACAFTITGGVLSWRADYLQPSAVVIEREAILHHGPLPESPTLQPVYDGQEFQVLDQKDEWLQVSGAARGIGWIERAHVALVPVP